MTAIEMPAAGAGPVDQSQADLVLHTKTSPSCSWATIQLQGYAQLLDWTDEEGTGVFKRFSIGRRILKAYESSRRRGETRVCFVKITIDPVIHTDMVGSTIWKLRKRMESGAATVINPRVDNQW